MLELNATVTVLCIASVPFTFKLSLISLALPYAGMARLSGLEWLVTHRDGLHACRRLPMIQVLTGPDGRREITLIMNNVLPLKLSQFMKRILFKKIQISLLSYSSYDENNYTC